MLARNDSRWTKEALTRAKPATQKRSTFKSGMPVLISRFKTGRGGRRAADRSSATQRKADKSGTHKIRKRNGGCVRLSIQTTCPSVRQTRREHGSTVGTRPDVSPTRPQGNEAAWTGGRLGEPSLPDAATHAGLSTPAILIMAKKRLTAPLRTGESPAFPFVAILIMAKKRLTAPLRTGESPAFPFVVGP